MTTSVTALSSASGAAASCRILVVEDLLLSQEIARSVLEAGGYTVGVAASGPEAIEAMREGAYGLVLMDLHMPGMDGYATAALMRSLPEARGRTRIAALTAHGGADDVERCRRAGMIGHVRKPFAPVALLEAVRNWAPSGPAEPRDRTDAWDQVAYGHLADRLGPTRMNEALVLFRASLASLLDVLDQPQLDVGKVDHACHGLTSTSGMLGFHKLSTASRSVMMAEDASLDASSLDDLRHAIHDVLVLLDERSASSAIGQASRTDAVAQHLA